VELRFCDRTPREVMRALRPPAFEGDPCEFFTQATVWAGNLVVEYPKRTEADARLLGGATSEQANREREAWLTAQLAKYDGIERVVYNFFYDTPMSGFYWVARRDAQSRSFETVEVIDYGQGAPHFSFGRDYVSASVDYIQSKYGFHLLPHEELAYPHSGRWAFDVEDIC
jgi:hypothetical protein